MRFLLFSLFALLCVAVGLCLGVLPIHGTTVWEKLQGKLPALATSTKAAPATSPSATGPSAAPAARARPAGPAAARVPAAAVEPSGPLGNYTAEERANIDRLIRGRP